MTPTQLRTSEPSCRLAHARPRRIGIVDMEAEPSGITRYVRALLDGIDRNEFEPVLFCRPDGPYRPPHAVPEVEIIHLRRDLAPTTQSAGAPKVPSSDFLTPSLRQLWRTAMPQPIKHAVGFLRGAGRMTGVFQAHPVDLLHIQVVANSMAAVAGHRAGIPRILATYHLDPKRSRLHEWLPEVLTTRCLDHAIAVSENTRSAWATRPGVRPRQLSVIPNGVEVAHYQRRLGRECARRQLGLTPQSGPVLVVVGRLEEQKGHRYLLDAFAQLARAFGQLTLLLAGDGTLRQPLADQAAALGISRRVRFLGHCAAVEPLLEAADVFVLPSLWEALPFALLEAMASALPVVATDVAGIPELVVPGETGHLVPPADAPALAAGLRRMIDSDDCGRSLGEAGRLRVQQHFSLRAMLAQTQMTYRRLLDSADPTSV